MINKGSPRRVEAWLRYHVDWVAALVVIVALGFRLEAASKTYFELDEAFHSLLALVDFHKFWRASLGPSHPPLLIFLLHFVRKFNSSEVALRLIPVLAGALFPWFVYRWLRLVSGKAGALFALVLLAAAPKLFFLGIVVRAYTLALLFSAAALYFLERAIRSGSARWMWFFGGSLYLAFLSEYSTAIFAAAIGVYFLLRVRAPTLTRGQLWIWAGTQVVCLSTYVFLYLVRVWHIRASFTAGESYSAYLRRYFPSPGETVWGFFSRTTFDVFRYLFDSKMWAAVGLVLFLTGLVTLAVVAWRRRSLPVFALLPLLILPFLLNCLASFLHFYPSGYARQTIYLALFIAAGVGIGVEQIVRHRIWIVLLAIPFFVHGMYDRSPVTPLSWNPVPRRELMPEALEYLRENVPPGSYILTEGFSSKLLQFYLLKDQWKARYEDCGQIEFAGYHVFYHRLTFTGLDNLAEDLRAWEKKCHLNPATGVWVFEAEEECALCRELAGEPGPGITHLRLFGEAIAIFKVPATYTDSNQSNPAPAVRSSSQ